MYNGIGVGGWYQAQYILYLIKYLYYQLKEKKKERRRERESVSDLLGWVSYRNTSLCMPGGGVEKGVVQAVTWQ